MLGPSGCGKTTLLRLIAGFDDPDAGTIALGDETVAGAGRPRPPQRRRVGYVPQEGALFPHLSVAANIGFGLRPQAAHGRPGRPSCWSWSGWSRRWPAGTRTSCPAASSSGWRWPGRWPRGRRSCCWTSRSPRWTPALREATRRAVARRAGGGRGDRGAGHPRPGRGAVAGRPGRGDAARPAGAAGRAGDGLPLALGRRGGRVRRRGGAAAGRGLAPGTRPASSARWPCRGRGCPARPGSCCGRSSWCSAPTARGVEARVRDVSYFGHDAAVRLELVPGGTEVLARVAGHDRPGRARWCG